MADFWKGLRAAVVGLGALAVVYLVTLFARTGSTVGTQGVRAKQLSNAKQLANAARMYAIDNDDHFPMHLAELEVDGYVDQRTQEQLLYLGTGDDGMPLPVKLDWLYFGAFFDEKNPPSLLIASPQAFVSGTKRKRLIIRGDGSASTVNESEYQQELRKTIEAMHKRAGTPPTPATEASPASPDAAAAPANPRTPAVPDEKPNIR